MTSTSPLHPWEERQPSYGLKLLAMVGAGLLLIIALVSLFVVIIAPIGMARNSPNPQGDLTALAIGLGLLLVSGFGLYKLFPILRQPTGFKPSYGAIAPDALGHPFEVQFQRAGWGRTMSSKGTLRFGPEAIMIEGWLSPGPLVQVAIVLLLTVLPLLVLRMGLGLIPALIIAYFVGRKRVTRSVPYQAIQNMRLLGSRASFDVGEGQPRQIAIAAASIDGERLYREVRQRFPGAG